MVANWLYGVAYQTARKAKGAVAKRAKRERQMAVIPEPKAVKHNLRNDLQHLLDQELVSPTPEALREYVGAYFSAELQTTYRVVLQNGGLFLVCRNTPDSLMRATVRDAFKARRRKGICRLRSCGTRGRACAHSTCPRREVSGACALCGKPIDGC
jgi:hypothetical protein